MLEKRKYSIREMTVRLARTAAPVKGLLAVSTAASIVGNLAQMGLMGFGALTLLRTSGKISVGTPFIYGLCMGISAFFIVLCRYMEGVFSHAASYRLLSAMRVHFFDALRRLGPAFLLKREKGDILNIAVSDIETIEFFFAHTIGPLFTVILLPVLTLLLAFWIQPLFGAALLPIYLVVSILFPLAAVKAGRRIGVRYRERLGKLQSLILESVYGLRDIQIFGFGGKRLERIQEENEKINAAARALTLHRQTVSAAPAFFVYLARIAILAAASYLAARSWENTAGVVVLSFVAAASFSSTQSLTMVVSSLLEAYAASERLFQIEDARPDTKEPENPRPTGKIREIAFENVDFSYGEGKGKILDGFSLTIGEREKIGVVGESGAGKSTILRLLLRFWKPTEGRILINGIPITEVSGEELYRRIAVLEQDTFLFSGTIAENIGLGNPKAGMEAIRLAALGAGLHEFIETLPQGYHTQMGQMGARLSGGEKQRVGIARTLLADPDVIVMDEPTSSLDVLHEKELLKTLRESCGEKMLLLVSHRASTLADCTRIVRLVGGKGREENGG